MLDIAMYIMVPTYKNARGRVSDHIRSFSIETHADDIALPNASLMYNVALDMPLNKCMSILEKKILEVIIELEEHEISLRVSLRSRWLTNSDDSITYLNEANINIRNLNDPTSYKESISNDHSSQRKEVMIDELDSMSKIDV